MNQSLLFRNFDSRPNTLKVFDNYRARVGFQGFSGNLIGDIPEQPINATPLFSRQPFQEPSLVSALVPCGLKIAALFESALSNVFDISALENLAGTGRGDSDNTRIHADARFGGQIRIFLSVERVKNPR